jgi:acetyl esterase/lipase
MGRIKSVAAIVGLLITLVSAAGCSRLGAFNAVVPKDGGVKLAANAVAYGTDPRQKLDIYASSDATASKGVIVFFYGGSWNSGDRGEYAFAARAFASRGYTTAVLDYRLVPEFRYPAFVEDGAKAVAWVHRNIARYGGDPDRIFLVGHSAGAYNEMMVALAPEFLRAEGLRTNVVKAVVGISGPYDFLPLAVDETREAFKGVADLPATQPINRVARGRPAPPMLLLHGEADEFVYPRNSKRLAAALRRAGHSVEEKYYPGIDHVGTLLAISRPLRDRAPVVDDIVRFLDAR